MRVLVTSCALLLAASACGDSAEPVATTTPPPPPTTTTAAVVTTTTAAPTTTMPDPTTTTTTVPAPLAPQALPDGRPATFVAVTGDFRAVEVDTVTGAVVAVHGQMSTPEELDAAGDEAAFEIVIDAAWRTSDGQYVMISECCEPAGGTIHYLADGQVLTPDTHDESITSDGWTAAPSPFSGDVAVLGYFLRVGAVGDLPVTRNADQRGPFPVGVPAWDRAGGRVYWLSDVGGGAAPTFLNAADLAEDDPDQWTQVELAWLGDQERLDGLAMQASGNLVAFRVGAADGSAGGVVFTPKGELVASFPVEDGSRFGGYDPTGRFLVYVDGEGNARWQGLGRSGVLGDGFTHASW